MQSSEIWPSQVCLSSLLEYVTQLKAGAVSQRGVVFLKNQDVTPQEMKEFMLRLTEVAGCPTSSGLHVHPLTEEGSELGDQISVISSEKQKKGGGLTHQLSDVSRYASAGWHSDITFEKVPSDYAVNFASFTSSKNMSELFLFTNRS